jgi:hypothetical protein
MSTNAVWLGWLAAFLALEIPAALNIVPWDTLSEFVWSWEDKDKRLRRVVLVGLAALAAHLVMNRSKGE